MPRIATRNVKPSGKPEPLGRPAPSAEKIAAAVERQLPLVDFPLKAAYFPDAYPLSVGEHDAAMLRRQDAFRARELADLPDTDPQDYISVDEAIERG